MRIEPKRKVVVSFTIRVSEKGEQKLKAEQRQRERMRAMVLSGASTSEIEQQTGIKLVTPI